MSPDDAALLSDLVEGENVILTLRTCVRIAPKFCVCSIISVDSLMNVVSLEFKINLFGIPCHLCMCCGYFVDHCDVHSVRVVFV